MLRLLSLRPATVMPFLLAGSFALAQTEPASTPRVMELVESRCMLCHGREGESASAVYPRLAAQHPDYLAKQLKDFREGRRKSDTMSGMVKDLQDDDFVGLAAWFASRKPASRRAGDADLAAVGKYIFTAGNSFSGVAACTTCHGPNGHGTPAIATYRRATSCLLGDTAEGIWQPGTNQRQHHHAQHRLQAHRT
jgi:cytochrome c553